MLNERLAKISESYDRTGYGPAEVWAVPQLSNKYWRVAFQPRQRKAVALMDDLPATPSRSRQSKRMRVLPDMSTSSSLGRRHHQQSTIHDVVMVDHELPDYDDDRSEEHTSELQSLMRISYAVFCLKKKRYITTT